MFRATLNPTEDEHLSQNTPQTLEEVMKVGQQDKVSASCLGTPVTVSF